MTNGGTAERALSGHAGRAEADAADAEAARITATLAALPSNDPRREMLRRQAITAWAPLARRLARRYAIRPGTLEDTEQTAIIGLIKAVDRFEPDLGGDFVAYVIPTIVGELKRYFRDHGWMIRVPRRLHDLHLKIKEANARLPHQLGRRPTITDIAHDLQCSDEEIIEGWEGGYAYRPASLSNPTSTCSGQELGDTLGAQACAVLAPETASELEESAGKPCAQAVLDEDLPMPGPVADTAVYGQWAQVRLSDDTVFLGVFGDGWRVVAAGCSAQGDQPYHCTLQGV
ncbi:sigma-70 family RNA polymerase sigma factor [Actinoplanes sp. NPDC051411]|uniref:sigma-70 family RNA polymerase sigma factor n=1 Tax=Actinoplanes sp. NPDC051411 TaxID=3155522 RepID=UPI00344973AE